MSENVGSDNDQKVSDRLDRLAVSCQLVSYEPMSYGEYCGKNGLKPKEELSLESPGYVVKMINGTGFIGWIAENVFNRDYRKVEALSFSIALEYLMQGKSITRKSWCTFEDDTPIVKQKLVMIDAKKEGNNYINYNIVTVGSTVDEDNNKINLINQNTIISMELLLANDWFICE